MCSSVLKQHLTHYVIVCANNIKEREQVDIASIMLYRVSTEAQTIPNREPLSFFFF